MRLWRICRAVHAGSAFSGEGARLFGGRWNSPGVRVVYTSPTLALAAIETFVNLEPNLRPDDLVSIEAELPDDAPMEGLDPKSLPRKWYEMRDESLRRFGDRWIHTGRTIALHVPSAAIRGEWNVLLNPAHPAFRKLKIEKPIRFEFDLRMFRKTR
jgi:RES domain-containing protein